MIGVYALFLRSYTKSIMNAITARISEFLKNFPPFNTLSTEDLQQIALSMRVINLEKHKILFQINDALHEDFYVVASGVINLTIIADAEETLVSKCKAGDIFGLRPFFAKNNYMTTAKAREDSLVYAIPIEAFRPYVARNPEVLNFLLESFASNARGDEKDSRGKSPIDHAVNIESQSEIQYFQSLAYNKTALKISGDTTIRDAAQLMTDNLMDSVIIATDNKPVGIVTDSDLRAKVVTGRVAATTPISKIMVSPVITVSENVSLAEAQLLLLKHNVSHLCVTHDGSDGTDIKGIVTQRDLVVAQASNPGILIKEIKHSRSAAELKSVRAKLTELIRTSITKNIPLTHINNISGEINLALARRSVELAILDLGSPPARFAWLCIGSQGRKEQLLLTDQDSILVFEDVAAEKYRDVKDYFVKLAKKATQTLEVVGYNICPHGHNASNMIWCKSLTDWIKQYNNWMNFPGESNEISSIFFDYEIAFGEPKIEEALTDSIFRTVRKNVVLFDWLGNDALRKPAPLSFFKKFNVEEDGEHRDKFDIKTRALMPLTDSARLIALSYEIRGVNNTYMRFKQLAMEDPRNSEIYLSAAEAYQILSRFRTLEGISNDNSGQYINIDEMTKNDRERLKNALGPIKDLEELIKDKFRLTQFS